MWGCLKLTWACLMTGSMAPFLRSYLSKYVAQGFTEDAQVQVSFWNGIVELMNLQLKPEALNGLSKLPIEFKTGYLGSVKVKLRKWRSFRQEPVKVELDHIFLLAEPDTSVEGARNERVPEEEEESKDSSDESNSAWLVSTIRTLVSTWLVRTLVGNLKISITNVHIRFEDEESNVGHPFVLGLTLAKLVAGNGSARDCVQKFGEVDRLSFYFETDTKPRLNQKSWADFKEQDWNKLFLNDDPEFYDAVTEFSDDYSEQESRELCSSTMPPHVEEKKENKKEEAHKPPVKFRIDLQIPYLQGWYSRAIGPELTVHDDIDAIVLPERHLQAILRRVVVTQRFSMEGDNMELTVELNGLTVESTSGVNVVEPFDASVTYSRVTGKQDIHASITEICTKFSFRTLQLMLRLQDNARASFVQRRRFGSSSPQSALGLADLRTQSQPDSLTVANIEVESFSAKFCDDFGGLMDVSIAPVKATFHRDMKSSVVIDFHNLTSFTYNRKLNVREPLTEQTCYFRIEYESDPVSRILVETPSDFNVNITVANVNMMLELYSSEMNLSKIEASSTTQELQVIRLRPHTLEVEAQIKENGGGHEIEQSVATQGATEPMQDEQERRAEAPSQMKIIVIFPKIGLSIIDQQPQELVFLSLEKVEVIYAAGQDEKGSRFEASVGYLQADNQLLFTTMPVLLASERVDGEDHVIKFIATLKAESNEAVQVYSLNLDLKVTHSAWRINFDEALYWAFMEMKKNLHLDQLELDSEVVQVDSRIRIETLDISAVRVKFSVKSSPEQCPEAELAGNWVHALFFQLGNIDKLPISFEPKSLGERELQAGVSSLLEANHVKVVPWLLLCVDSPRVTSSILHVLSRVLKKLSEHDHNHSNIQNVNSLLQDVASNDVIGVRDGFTRGVIHFGCSLKCGGIEALRTWSKGAQENGPAEFLQGIGKGIRQFLNSTAVGALEGAAVATAGAGNTWRKEVSRKFRPNRYKPERRRPPRAFKGPGIVIPSDFHAAEDEAILQAAHRDGNGMSENESLLTSDGYQDLKFRLL